MFNIFSKGLKVQEKHQKDTNEFLISYPMQKGKYVPMGDHIIMGLLREYDCIVYINSFLSFSAKTDIDEKVEKLKDLLNEASIEYRQMYFKAASQAGLGGLGALFQQDRKKQTFEVIVFNLHAGSNEEKILNTISSMGCQIFAPLNNDDTEKSIDKLVSEDLEGLDKNSLFKFSSYISDYLGQAVIRTKYLTLDDIQRICR